MVCKERGWGPALFFFLRRRPGLEPAASNRPPANDANRRECGTGGLNPTEIGDLPPRAGGISPHVN